MGTYTANFDLYKVDSSENVDVDSQVNRNLDIIDGESKPLLEWKSYSGSSISGDVGLIKKLGYKFFKSYSNSLWFWNGSTTVQDPNVTVDSWLDTSSYMASGYTGVGAVGSSTWPHMRARLISGSNYEVTLSGQMKLSSGAELPLNTTTTILTLPSSLFPLRPFNFLVAAPGGSSVVSTYSIARIGITVSGGVTYYRMGDNAGATSVRYVCLDGVRFSMDVAP